MATREVIRRYDATAESYDELYQEEQGLKYISAWKIIFKMNGKLVDIGCGTLLFERFLKLYGIFDNFNYIVALDISENMLKVGLSKVRNDKEFERKIDVVRGDASRLPFRDSSFEYGVSFTVFTLLTSTVMGIMEMKRVVNIEGLFSLLKKFNRIQVDEDCRLIAETEKDSIYVFKKEKAKEVFTNGRKAEKVDDLSRR
ncbi:MAG: class I SAM-dependent methyltransferase [Fervidicoccaceae archaeon]